MLIVLALVRRFFHNFLLISLTKCYMKMSCIYKSLPRSSAHTAMTINRQKLPAVHIFTPIIGPKRTSDKVNIHNDVFGTPGTNYPIYSSIHEDAAQHNHHQRKKKKKWAGWRPVNYEAQFKYKKDIDDKIGQSSKRRFRDKQTSVEEAAKQVAHTT